MPFERPAQSLWAGAVFIIAGELMFASMGVGIRLVAAELPNESVVFFRNLFSLFLLTPWLLRSGVGGFKTGVPHVHLLRGIAGVGAMYCFFYAIANIPLANAMLLKLTAPLFMPLLALWWLREPVAPPSAFGWLLAIALFATLGQLCLTNGLSLAPAARMGSFGYFAVIFGAAYGWLLWDEILMWWTVAGAISIVTAGMIAASRPAAAKPLASPAPAPCPQVSLLAPELPANEPLQRLALPPRP